MNACIKKTVGLISFLCLATSVQGQIYQCKGQAGKLIFTDKPCENAQTVDLKHANIAASPDIIDYPMAELEQYSSAHWYQDARGYDKAFRQAKTHQAPMIIYFRTNWCSFCLAFEKTVLNQSEAKEAIKYFVKVRVNPDHGTAEKKLFKSMKGSGYPSFFVKNEQEQVKKLKVTRSGPQKSISALQFKERIKPYTPEKKKASPKNAKAFHARAIERFQ